MKIASPEGTTVNLSLSFVPLGLDGLLDDSVPQVETWGYLSLSLRDISDEGALSHTVPRVRRSHVRATRTRVPRVLGNAATLKCFVPLAWSILY